MNLLIFSLDFKPNAGGIAEYAHQVARGLTRLGDHVVVMGPQIEGAEAFDRTCGYPVVRINVGDPHRRWPWQRLARHLRRRKTFAGVVAEHGIEHVFFTEWGMLSWSASRWGKRAGRSYSVLVHGRETTDDYTVATRPPKALDGLKGAELVFVNSRFTAEVVSSTGVPRGRIRLAHPGVDPDDYNPGPVSDEDRRRLDVLGRKVVLTVCRLVRRKGVDRSLEAIAKVAQSVPEVTYLVCGDGPDHARLQEMCRKLALTDRVKFLGHIEGGDFLRLYRMCDCFLMPARELPGGDVEGFGIVFLEANACGKPVVAGRSGGMVEAVLDGQTGLVVDPEDVGEIADAVTKLLTDRELAERLGRQGRKRVEETLCWKIRVSEIRKELLALRD